MGPAYSAPIPQYGSTNVPHGTIKKGYDVFEHGNWDGLLKYDRIMGRPGKYASSCNKTYEVPGDGENKSLEISKIINPQGRWRMGEHRDTWCTNFWSNKDCGNCELWKNDKDAQPGILSSAKVPIGLKAHLVSGNASGNCDSHWCCDYNHGNKIGYNYGDFKDENKWPKRMNKDVAIGCSGGWNKNQNEFVNSLGKNVWNNSSKESSECWIGNPWLKNNDDIVCIYGDVEPTAFCQMGDYVVSTDICKKECEELTVAPNKFGDGAKGKEHCRFGLDRLCGTVPEEVYKRDSNGNVVKMPNGRYPLFDEEKCIQYCVGSNTSNCNEIKKKVCTSRIDDWKTNPKLVDYCKSYWLNNPDFSAMSNAYKKTLMDPLSGQDVMSNNGLGKLCDAEGTNVNDHWCKEMKTAYCTSKDSNMLTDKCYEFCADPDNADQCDDYVKNMCRNRMGIENEEDMKTKVSGTKNDIASWCGCMMSPEFYREITAKKLQKFDDLGYDVRGEIDISPECSYKYCKEGAIKTKSQQGRLDNSECKDCVQVMLTSFENSTFIDSDIAQQQSMQCGNISKKPDPLPPGIYNMTSTGQKYRINNDLGYCTYENEEDFERDLRQSGDEIIDFDGFPGDHHFDDGICDVPIISSASTAEFKQLARTLGGGDEEAGTGIFSFLIILFIGLGFLGLLFWHKYKYGNFRFWEIITKRSKN